MLNDDDAHLEAALERILGPSLPDEERLRRWTIDEWCAWCEAFDRGRYPLLEAMEGRGETAEECAAAVRRAEEIEAEWLRSAGTFMCLEEGTELLTIDVAGAHEACSAGGRGEVPERPLSIEEVAMTVEGAGDRAAFRRESATFAALWEFDLDFEERLGPHFRDPSVQYLQTLLWAATMGMIMGRTWALDVGVLAAYVARLLLASRRLQAVGRVLWRLPILELKALAPRAFELAQALRMEADQLRRAGEGEVA
jgi:hypothetical protein